MSDAMMEHCRLLALEADMIFARHGIIPGLGSTAALELEWALAAHKEQQAVALYFEPHRGSA